MSGSSKCSALLIFILVLVFGLLRPVLNNITGAGRALGEWPWPRCRAR